MLAKIKTSLLTVKHAAQLQLEPFTDGHTLDIQPHWAGFKIPYFTLDGKVDHAFYRFRLMQTLNAHRYSQSANSGCNVYMPPLFDEKWSDIAQRVDVSLVITEGELKAACGCVSGIPTLGLGGVYDLRNATGVFPVLETFAWSKRRVYLCFDSNFVDNPMMRIVEGRLAQMLAQRGADVLWTTIPPGQNYARQGMDDYIYINGIEAFRELLTASELLGSSIAKHEMNGDVAVIMSTTEIIALATGDIHSAKAFTDVAYRDRSFDDMTNGKVTRKFTAKEWLAWPYRTKVSRIEYDPGCAELITTDGSYNVWRALGWGCVASSKGTVQPWQDLLARMFNGSPEDTIQWVRQWFACPLQQPGIKMHSALLIWGTQTGTGKTMLGDTMRHIYGRNFGTVSNTQLSSQFNEWLANKQFIVGDEIALGDKRHLGDWFKDMISGESITVNSKNRKEYTVKNRVHFYFTSNHDDAMYIEGADRRIFVHDVSAAPLVQSEYRAYLKWLREDGGAERLFQYLLHEVDLTDFDPVARPPMTRAKLEMTIGGRGDLEDWAIQLKNDPQSILGLRRPWDLYTVDELLPIYDADRHERVKSMGMGRALKRAGILCVAHGNNSAVVDGMRARFYAVRHPERYMKMASPAEAKKIYLEEREEKLKSERIKALEAEFKHEVAPQAIARKRKFEAGVQ
jgi:hypothetical protein